MTLDYLFDAAERARVEYAEKDAPLKGFVVAFRRFYDAFKNDAQSPRFALAAPFVHAVENKLPELEENPDPVGFWRAWENARERVAQYDAANEYAPDLSTDDDAESVTAPEDDARAAVEAVARIAGQEPEPVEGAPEYESDVAAELDAAIQAGEAPRTIAARLGLSVEEVKARMDAFSVQPKSKKHRR